MSEGLEERAAAVARAAGWEPLGSDPRKFTYDVADGFRAVAHVGVSRDRDSKGPSWAVASCGVGYFPATELGPRLTLDPEPALVVAPGQLFLNRLNDPGDPPDEQLCVDEDEFVSKLPALLAAGLAFARAHASLESMEAVLRTKRSEWEHVSADLPLFLAATGRASEALATVEADLVSGFEGCDDREFRRFARQLRLWVAAGAPLAPPLDAWPPGSFESAPREPRQSREERRAERRLRQEAFNAVRRRGRGASRRELANLLTEELSERGLDASPIAVTILAGLLDLERRPFGRARSRLSVLTTAGSMLWGVGRSLVGAFKDEFDDTPAWLEPPEDACFEVPALDRWLRVHLDADAGEWLGRVAASAGSYPRVLTQCDAWLEPAPAGHLVVHLGARRVGTLSGPDAALFDAAVAAASCYAELPCVSAQLLWSDDDEESRVLAVAAPGPVHQPPPF